MSRGRSLFVRGALVVIAVIALVNTFEGTVLFYSEHGPDGVAAVSKAVVTDMTVMLGVLWPRLPIRVVAGLAFAITFGANLSHAERGFGGQVSALVCPVFAFLLVEAYMLMHPPVSQSPAVVPAGVPSSQPVSQEGSPNLSRDVPSHVPTESRPESQPVSQPSPSTSEPVPTPGADPVGTPESQSPNHGIHLVPTPPEPSQDESRDGGKMTESQAIEWAQSQNPTPSAAVIMAKTGLSRTAAYRVRTAAA